MTIRGVTISNMDDRNVLAIDLKHLLMVLGRKGSESIWRLKDVEVIGGSADAMHDLSDRAESVPGEALIKFANGIAQVIDGEFAAHLSGSVQSWVRIRAVDSTAFDITTTDMEMYREIRKQFPDASELFNLEEQ